MPSLARGRLTDTPGLACWASIRDRQAQTPTRTWVRLAFSNPRKCCRPRSFRSASQRIGGQVLTLSSASRRTCQDLVSDMHTARMCNNICTICARCVSCLWVHVGDSRYRKHTTSANQAQPLLAEPATQVSAHCPLLLPPPPAALRGVQVHTKSTTSDQRVVECAVTDTSGAGATRLSARWRRGVKSSAPDGAWSVNAYHMRGAGVAGGAIHRQQTGIDWRSEEGRQKRRGPGQRSADVGGPTTSSSTLPSRSSDQQAMLRQCERSINGV